MQRQQQWYQQLSARHVSDHGRLSSITLGMHLIDVHRLRCCLRFVRSGRNCGNTTAEHYVVMQPGSGTDMRVSLLSTYIGT
jgi:hypothetical protein